MNAMYRPHNGRLDYGRGKIAVVFAHYNHFGLYEDGGRNDHTGDTMFYLDEEDGQNEQLVWGWGASHSLCQRTVWDGQAHMTSALGDAYPQQIRFYGAEMTVDGGIGTKMGSSEVLPGSIPGNGGGATSGRLGGLSEMRDGLFVQSYARRPTSTSFQGTASVSNLDETGLLFFNRTLTPLKQTTLAPGMHVNTVKSAKYGRNILVGYTTIPETTEVFMRARVEESGDTMHMMLVDGCGEVITPSFSVANTSITANDDWEVLKDGRVAWTHVSDEGELSYHFLPAPPTDNSPSYCDMPGYEGAEFVPVGQPGSGGSNGGAIAGAVIGTLLAVGLIGAGVWYFLVRKKQAEEDRSHAAQV